MNELNTVKGGIGGVADFVQTEAPELVREILRWVGCLSFAGFICCVVGIVICLVLAKRLWIASVALENKTNSEASDGDGRWVGLRFCNLLFIVPVTVLFMRVWCQLDWLKILIAPRVFLLEYISNLIK
jgi:hypothetical protein